MKTKMPFSQAYVLALEFCCLVRSCCERLEIAGSLRRKASVVGDIEIVAAPKVITSYNLFQEPSGEEDLLEAALEGLCLMGIVERGARWGPRYKQIVFRDRPVDLFIVKPPAQWGVILAIRTGPAGFSKKLVTSRRKGGFLPAHLKVKNGAIWNGGEIIITPEEEDVFRILGLGWLEPQNRYKTIHRKWEV